MKLLRQFDPEFNPFLPVQLLLELTTVCNLTCRTCYRFVGNVTSRQISKELLDKVIQQIFPHIYHLELIGLGESLCSPHFLSIVDTCRSMGIRLGTSTNGLLVTPVIANQLAAGGARVVLSVDGCSDETLGYVRPGVTRDKIANAMTCFQSAAKEYSTSGFEWSIHIVLLRSNLNEIDDLLRWGASFGCRRFSLSHFDTLDRTDVFASECMEQEHESIYSMIPVWLKTADSLNVSFLIPPGMLPNRSADQNYNFGKRPGRYFQKCYLPWRETQVFVDGVVTQCCVGGTNLGNLNDMSFKQIWNGQLYRQVRRTIHSGHPPEPCARCTMEYGITGGDPAYLKRCREAGYSSRRG